MFLAWLVMLGVDVFLHAGLLAPLYNWDGSFLLSPAQAFVRIPIGYAAFLLLAGGLVWLLSRLGVRGGATGASYGAGAGALVWGALLLGLWSISTADPPLLIGWWLGQSLGLAVGGYVVGAALAGAPLRRVAAQAVVLVVLCAVSAVVLQTIGYARAPLVLGS